MNQRTPVAGEYAGCWSVSNSTTSDQNTAMRLQRFWFWQGLLCNSSYSWACANFPCFASLLQNVVCLARRLCNTSCSDTLVFVDADEWTVSFSRWL